MRIKESLFLRQIADTWAVLPLHKDVLNFDGMLTLNETGAFLWKRLEQGADRKDLADALRGEYDVSLAEALADVDAFITKLVKAGCVE